MTDEEMFESLEAHLSQDHPDQISFLEQDEQLLLFAF